MLNSKLDQANFKVNVLWEKSEKFQSCEKLPVSIGNALLTEEVCDRSASNFRDSFDEFFVMQSKRSVNSPDCRSKLQKGGVEVQLLGSYQTG